jgi:flagellar hook-length control protein FliK
MQSSSTLPFVTSGGNFSAAADLFAVAPALQNPDGQAALSQPTASTPQAQNDQQSPFGEILEALSVSDEARNSESPEVTNEQPEKLAPEQSKKLGSILTSAFRTPAALPAQTENVQFQPVLHTPVKTPSEIVNTDATKLVESLETQTNLQQQPEHPNPVANGLQTQSPGRNEKRPPQTIDLSSGSNLDYQFKKVETEAAANPSLQPATVDSATSPALSSGIKQTSEITSEKLLIQSQSTLPLQVDTSLSPVAAVAPQNVTVEGTAPLTVDRQQTERIKESTPSDPQADAGPGDPTQNNGPLVDQGKSAADQFSNEPFPAQSSVQQATGETNSEGDQYASRTNHDFDDGLPRNESVGQPIAAEIQQPATAQPIPLPARTDIPVFSLEPGTEQQGKLTDGDRQISVPSTGTGHETSEDQTQEPSVQIPAPGGPVDNFTNRDRIVETGEAPLTTNGDASEYRKAENSNPDNGENDRAIHFDLVETPPQNVNSAGENQEADAPVLPAAENTPIQSDEPNHPPNNSVAQHGEHSQLEALTAIAREPESPNALDHVVVDSGEIPSNNHLKEVPKSTIQINENLPPARAIELTAPAAQDVNVEQLTATDVSVEPESFDGFDSSNQREHSSEDQPHETTVQGLDGESTLEDTFVGLSDFPEPETLIESSNLANNHDKPTPDRGSNLSAGPGEPQLFSARAPSVAVDPAFTSNPVATIHERLVANTYSATSVQNPVATSISAFDAETINSLRDQVSHTLFSELRAVTQSAEASSITIDLHPAELGRLTLSVGVENEAISATIITSELTTNDLLTRDKQILIDVLREQGLEVDSFEISYGRGENQEHAHDSDSAEQQRFAFSTQSPAAPAITSPDIESGNTSGINLIA